MHDGEKKGRKEKRKAGMKGRNDNRKKTGWLKDT